MLGPFIKSALITLLLSLSFASNARPQGINPYKPDLTPPREITGMKLVWNEEFNINGLPDTLKWGFEKGFVRNKELQWYKKENAYCLDGVLVIEGRRERTINSRYKEGSGDWRINREYAEYTSASINTRGKFEWLYGRIEVRARIDTSMGAWPAIWTLGKGEWPRCGETDIMEFYRRDFPIILANVAWGSGIKGKAKWNERTHPFAYFSKNDPEWEKKFHIWRMDWDEESIKIYLDDELLNEQELNATLNPDGTNPFKKPHYLLLNLAIGSNGGDPSASMFPVRFEVDYARVYRKAD